MSLEVKTNWLLEIVWFTAKAINFGLWLAFAVIIAYYLLKYLKERFRVKKVVLGGAENFDKFTMKNAEKPKDQ